MEQAEIKYLRDNYYPFGVDEGACSKNERLLHEKEYFLGFLSLDWSGVITREENVIGHICHIHGNKLYQFGDRSRDKKYYRKCTLCGKLLSKKLIQLFEGFLFMHRLIHKIKL